MSPTILFTHLKIILLQCFQFSVFSFQFSVFSNNKLNPNGPYTKSCLSCFIVILYIFSSTHSSGRSGLQRHYQLIDLVLKVMRKWETDPHNILLVVTINYDRCIHKYIGYVGSRECLYLRCFRHSVYIFYLFLFG